jgi:hypothetical protein
LLGSFKRVNSGKIENWLDSLLDAAWSDVWKLAAQWHEAHGTMMSASFAWDFVLEMSINVRQSRDMTEQ